MGLFPGVNFHPGNFTFSAVGLFHRSVKYFLGGPPDVRANAVTFNKGNDGIIGDNICLYMSASFFLLYYRLEICYLESKPKSYFSGRNRLSRTRFL